MEKSRVPSPHHGLLTLFCRGEENIYLDDFDVKLRKKLLCTLFLKKISIPVETEKRIFFNFMFNVKKWRFDVHF